MDYQEEVDKIQKPTREANIIEIEEEKSRFSIPKKLRFPLIWTIFFIIIGITIQSIKSSDFVFFSFFGSNYIEWFRSLGHFTDITYYESYEIFVKNLASGWYYFFYTGGLLSLIWAFIYWIVHKEIGIKQKY